MELQHYLFLVAAAVAAMADDNIEQLLHSGNNQFTSTMLSEVLKQNPHKSVVISAFSVMTPLAQLAVASSGPSHDELLRSIGLPNDEVTTAVFSHVDKKLKSVQGVELKTANKIYIPLGYELNDKFAAVSRDVFNSEVANVDFGQSKATAKEINTWVEDKTNHRIKDLVDPGSLDSNTRAVLVNALYFKGSWMTPFKKMLTRDRDFHVSKEKVVKVPMMYNKEDYKYAESTKLKSKILQLPYVGGQSSMIVVLPDEVEGIEDLKEKLKDLTVLDEEIKNMYEVEVEVSLPKFKIETTTDLKQILVNINVTKLFTAGQAQLDKLLKTPENLYVTDAVQKAFIEVNEEGAEAAAANQFGIAFASAIINAKEYRFTADHPFVLFLMENDNILFSAVYYA